LLEKGEFAICTVNLGRLDASDRTINQLIDLFHQSIGPSINLPINQSVHQAIASWINRPINQSVYWSFD